MAAVQPAGPLPRTTTLACSISDMEFLALVSYRRRRREGQAGHFQGKREPIRLQKSEQMSQVHGFFCPGRKHYCSKRVQIVIVETTPRGWETMARHRLD